MFKYWFFNGQDIEMILFLGLAVSFLLCFLNQEVRVLLTRRWHQFWAGEAMRQGTQKHLDVAMPRFLETLPLNGLQHKVQMKDTFNDTSER